METAAQTKSPLQTMNKSRIEAFSDGVIAIIITLLVLELKVPKLAPGQPLVAALQHLLPTLGAWLLSFWFVAVFWLNHHKLFEHLEKADYGLAVYNTVFLCTLSFVPFPTAVLGEYSGQGVSLLLFGGTMVLCSLSFSLLRWHIHKRPHLLKAPVATKRLLWRSLVLGPGLYAVSTAVGWWLPWLGFVGFIAIPLYFLIPHSPK